MECCQNVAVTHNFSVQIVLGAGCKSQQPQKKILLIFNPFILRINFHIQYVLKTYTFVLCCLSTVVVILLYLDLQQPVRCCRDRMVIKSPNQRLETCCFCSDSYY
jgi:hypothetical protein